MIEFVSQLPTEYQEVEYIQSNGTQYIDTGFIVNKSDNYVLEIDGLFPSQAQVYQGCNGYMQFYVTSVYGISANSSVAVGNRNTVRVEYTNQTETLFVDGVQIESKSWSSAYNGSNVKLALLRMGDTNNGWYNGTAQGTIYSYKVQRGNLIVSECVPCIRNSDGVAGMYDIIREQFITNAGSGVFTVGANSNKHVIATITPGGIISPSAAQRRRMVMRKIVKMVTLTLTGSFDNSGLFGERYVTVDGEIITELGTYKVRQGSTIILHTRISPIMGGNDSYGIFVNGRCVKNALNCINHGPDYEYTVTCSCTVNGQGSVHERGGYARIDITTEEPTIDTGTDVTLNIVTGETEDGNTNKLGTIGFAKNPTTTFVNRASSNEWQTVTVNANTVYAQNTFQFNGSFTIGVEITNTLDNLLTDKVIDFWNGNADESVTNVESINDGTKITAQYTVERDATQQTVVDFEVAADPEIAATVTFTNSSIT